MGASFPNFRNNSNSDYPKFGLTLISEYQKYPPWASAPGGLESMSSICSSLKQKALGENCANAIDKLDAGALRRAAGKFRQGAVL
jgi:hypothetical protein